MSITRYDPYTVHLGGPKLLVDEYPASEAITPGHLVEFFDDSGTPKVRKHATDDEQVSLVIALERDEMNKNYDVDYATGDQVKAAFLNAGSTFWGLIASGQDISAGELLQSAGDGTLKTASATTAAANVARFQALTAPGSVTELTRLVVQVI